MYGAITSAAAAAAAAVLIDVADAAAPQPTSIAAHLYGAAITSAAAAAAAAVAIDVADAAVLLANTSIAAPPLLSTFLAMSIVWTAPPLLTPYPFVVAEGHHYISKRVHVCMYVRVC